MTKEKRNNIIQIRINESEKKDIDKIREIDKDFEISSFVRKKITEYSIKLLNNGIGNLKVG